MEFVAPLHVHFSSFVILHAPLFPKEEETHLRCQKYRELPSFPVIFFSFPSTEELTFFLQNHICIIYIIRFDKNDDSDILKVSRKFIG